MMVKRTVLKVDISCHKCKKKLLMAISSLEGVDKIEVDPDKGTLTVTGDADPYDVILRARKAALGKYAHVVSIGPPPKTEAPKKPDEKKPVDKKPDDKKPDEKKPEPRVEYQVQYLAHCHSPYGCAVCQQMAYCHVAPAWEEPNQSCSIM